MQKFLHEFDMNFGGTIMSTGTISSKNKQYYLLSSLMEEAIASSQMEGANTTRRVAKDMLRKQAKPKNKDQQMIVNNYNTIRYLSEHKDEALTPELLLEIHGRISEKTLTNCEDEGKFRKDDNIVVMDELHGEIAHTPPSHTSIQQYIQDLCDFANNDEKYIHPIVKAIIIHFMISYVHPFVDGNGRTARSLFYWYMLKKGYWLTEFLSISRIIYKTKSQYEKSFLYVENDDLDLGYFINYHLNILQRAFDELKSYLDKKSKEIAVHKINLNECRDNIEKQNENLKNLEENYRQIQQIWLQKQEEISKNNKKIEELRKEVERKEGKTCQDAIKNIDSVLKQNLYL